MELSLLDCESIYPFLYDLQSLIKNKDEMKAEIQNLLTDDKLFHGSIIDGRLDIIKTLPCQHLINKDNFNLAAEYGHLDIMKYFVTKGVLWHHIKDETLNIAIGQQNFEIIKWLLINGADLQNNNYKALNMLCFFGNYEILQWILQDFSKIRKFDLTKIKPRLLETSKDNNEIVQLLNQYQ